MDHLLEYEKFEIPDWKLSELLSGEILWRIFGEYY